MKGEMKGELERVASFRGSASGSLGAIQQVAGSVGVATIATLYTATSHPAARGLAITALATAGLLAAGAALTLLLPPNTGES